MGIGFEHLRVGDRVGSGNGRRMIWGTVHAVYYRGGTPEFVDVVWDTSDGRHPYSRKPVMVPADHLFSVDAAIAGLRLGLARTGTNRVLDDRSEPGDVC